MFKKPEHSLLHQLLVLSNRVAYLPAPVLALIVIVLAASAGQAWMDATRNMTLSVAVGLALALFMAGDWAMLAGLPRAGRSFGPVGLALLGLALMRWLLALAAVAIRSITPWTVELALIGNLALTGNVLDSLWAEPFRLGVTRLLIRSSKLAGHLPLRVLHLSDLHLERMTPREQELLELVGELRPDLIVFTGDFLNLSYVHDGRAQAECRELLSRLHAPFGVFAVTGSPSVDPPEVADRLLQGLDICRLDNQCQAVSLSPDEEPALVLVGVTCTHDVRADAAALGRTMALVDGSPFTILLYHTPDLMPDAARAGVDLFLSGHTHGGQIRLPLIGALVTSSRFWKRYEMGRYVEKNTTLYVSRGIGLEGMGAPRARFMCPPEIELIELRGPDEALPPLPRPRKRARTWLQPFLTWEPRSTPKRPSPPDKSVN